MQGQKFRAQDTDLVLEIDAVLPESCSAKQAGDKVVLYKGMFVEQF